MALLLAWMSTAMPRIHQYYNPPQKKLWQAISPQHSNQDSNYGDALHHTSKHLLMWRLWKWDLCLLLKHDSHQRCHTTDRLSLTAGPAANLSPFYFSHSSQVSPASTSVATPHRSLSGGHLVNSRHVTGVSRWPRSKQTYSKQAESVSYNQQVKHCICALLGGKLNTRISKLSNGNYNSSSPLFHAAVIFEMTSFTTRIAQITNVPPKYASNLS